MIPREKPHSTMKAARIPARGVTEKQRQELESLVSELRDRAGLLECAALTLPTDTANSTPDPAEDVESVATQPEQPKKLLFGWNQILDALNLTNDKETRNRVSRLNDSFVGPIVQGGGQGNWPMVDADSLVAWWNDLARLHAERVQRTTDTEATVAESYQHGKAAEVVPGIAGHVQKRRGKRGR